MKYRLFPILCLIPLLALACGGKVPPAIAHPKKFTVKSARVFTDGTRFDLSLEGRLAGGKVKATLQGEINGESVNQPFTVEGKKAESWKELAAQTSFLSTEEETSRPDAGGTITVKLSDADGEEVTGSPRNPGEWRNLLVDAIKLSKQPSAGRSGD